MSSSKTTQQCAVVDELYAEAVHWDVNTGEETIHAKRISGVWRNVKWWSYIVWLPFFLGPYLRLGDRQAVLFDIPSRKFHIFNITVLPQDFWMLSLVLLFLAILLALVTATVGRVWCGYLCFQTIWTDIYTWIEEKLEGSPQKRRKLEQAPWGVGKIGIKVAKHFLWLLIAAITGISFVAWFVDAYELWGDIFTLQLSETAMITIALFVAGTYVLAGFLREQVCFWLCPYARIQGVMVDSSTIIPTYDFHRGEPRGRMKKGEAGGDRSLGDCVSCNQCIAVCPTGVDIREGQQEGCIMCALCIDACDAVMDKVKLPRGLIRYESLDELNGKQNPPVHRRPRVWVYSAIALAALSGIIFGLNSLDAVELKVLHSRQPLFVIKSDGSIRNRYTLKVLNKTTSDLKVKVTASGQDGLQLSGTQKQISAAAGSVSARTVFVSVPRQNLTGESGPILFHIEGTDGADIVYSYTRESVFIGPKR
ncbi:MAG: cytochrome c oxidase accessory protein CcoG [Gammaproteobacteria bacterium]|nr:cytochrome c oxidase accessory protein CcoG [Gammaproteobacteria bacterium]